MIPEEPTPDDLKPVLNELPRVYTREEAIAILVERYDRSEPNSIHGMVLALAEERGIYPDDLKVL